MKKLAVIAFVALVSTTSFAQPAPPQQNGPHPEAILVHYLQLTSDQITQWAQIGKDTGAAVKPIADNVATMERQLHDALQASAPDAAAVGALVVSIDAAHDQIKALQDSAKNRRIALLTADQKVKFEAFEAAAAFLQQKGPRP